MTILISGIAGFVGSTLAKCLAASHEVVGFDSFVRPGSETNRQDLQSRGIRILHADVRSRSDIEALPPVEWVIDAAANPSVLAGVDGATSSRQLVEHNLEGTVNLLEFCKIHDAGFTLLSTSRVYSIAPLASLPMRVENEAFLPDFGAGAMPPGVSAAGVSEVFPAQPPVSLYGATKLASETLALEYGATFGFPVWINRCGVLAGAGQFGKADQGIFSFWIHSWARGRPLRYIGFGGNGHQVRDCLHPRDLVSIMEKQFQAGTSPSLPQIVNLSGGLPNSLSLAGLSAWCREHLGPGKSERTLHDSPDPRPFDIPWMVLDSTLAADAWGWRPATPLHAVLDEIARHARDNPHWLDLTGR